jgi:hypothetical protein
VPSAYFSGSEFFQSNTLDAVLPPLAFTTSRFASTLNSRFSLISGKSLRSTETPQIAAAAMPTKPVPEPSSKTFGLLQSGLHPGTRDGKRRSVNDSSFLAIVKAVPQVLRPRLSPVSGGSRILKESSGWLSEAGIIQVRVISGIAVIDVLAITFSQTALCFRRSEGLNIEYLN